MSRALLPSKPTSPLTPEWLVFDDPRSRELLRCIERLGPTEATVLILGETGTGKEMVARRLHELSARAGGPFVPVNCGALTDTLVDSELFGHDRGAFTGATLSRSGWFEAAHGGTLFLDEIGDLPLPMQVKLLRVLQEREVVRLGSRQAIPIDVRVVAATNVDLQGAVAAGRFREDLYYRLDVATLRLAPLHERPGDIPQLALRFLRSHAERAGVDEPLLTDDALGELLRHRWPGNVRELENVLQRALLVCQHGRVVASDLGLHVATPRDEVPRRGEPDTAALAAAVRMLFEKNLPDLHARIEEVVMNVAYQYCERNQLQTARLLGISRNVVRARLIQYGVLPAGARTAAALSGRHVLHAMRVAS